MVKTNNHTICGINYDLRVWVGETEHTQPHRLLAISITETDDHFSAIKWNQTKINSSEHHYVA